MTHRARLLDGKVAAERIRAEVAAGVKRLASAAGIEPGLAVVVVGDDPASRVYVRNKERAAREAGMRSEVVRLPASTSQAALLGTIARLNDNPAVHGVLVQLPLPAAIDPAAVLLAIDVAKDVDGFHPVNVGRLALGLPGAVPCTPAGVVALLEQNAIPVAGRRAVVVGRSNIVGKPLALLLLREHATVTVAHSRTADLAAVTREADILVVAIGRPGFIGADHLKPGAVVVDVGIHTISDEAACRRIFGDDPTRLAQIRERGSTLAGDVRFVEAAAIASWITPVPGGVGPLTIAMLLANTLRAAETAAKPGS